MADASIYWDPAEHVTVHCEGAVVGGTFVAISGPMTGGQPTVGTAGGGTSGLTTSVVGVAEFDGAAADKTTVMTEGVIGILTGGVITAGAKLTFDAAGKAIVATGAVFHAIAWDDAADASVVPAYLTLNRAIDTDT